MSKFKVGDEVVVDEEGTIGVVEKVLKNNNYEVVIEGELVYIHRSFEEYELKPYKTPHQELLDLGWKVLDDRNNIMLYHLLVDGKFYYQIKIDNIIKSIDLSYEDVSGYRTTTQLDLKLTSILKRYLEELE